MRCFLGALGVTMASSSESESRCLTSGWSSESESTIISASCAMAFVDSVVDTVFSGIFWGLAGFRVGNGGLHRTGPFRSSFWFSSRNLRRPRVWGELDSGETPIITGWSFGTAERDYR